MRIASTQVVVSTIAKRVDGQQVEIRQCTEPEARLLELYKNLGMESTPLKRKRKICVVHFPEVEKTILENQRVMRLKAASWVNSQQSDDPVSVKFARISDQAHNHALQSLKLYRMYLDAKENPDGLTKVKVEDHKKKMYEHLKKDISF